MSAMGQERTLASRYYRNLIKTPDRISERPPREAVFLFALNDGGAGHHARPLYFHGPYSDTVGVLTCSQASESRSKHVRGPSIAI
jgi:hypothetical protein